MKKIVLLLALVAANFWMLKAQILTIDQSYIQVNFLASDYSVEAYTYVHNNSSVVRSFRWIRIVESEPNGWMTTVCDKNLCYSPNTSSQDFELGVDSMGLIKLNVFPGGVAGDGSYQINVYDINDSANANVTLTVDASATLTGISNVNGEVISIYPNPVKDMLYMNLDESKHISSVEIYNVVGQKMKTVNLLESLKSVAIPVADLKKGVYFIRAISGGKEIVTRTFSKY